MKYVEIATAATQPPSTSHTKWPVKSKPKADTMPRIRQMAVVNVYVRGRYFILVTLKDEQLA